jgi:hypothetical protein
MIYLDYNAPTPVVGSPYAEQLQGLGFGRVLPLRGGIRDWRNDEGADGAK